MEGYLILLVIAIVFLPGFLWTNIDSKFSSVPNPSFVFYIANSFMFGVITYSLLFLFAIFIGLVSGIELEDLIIDIEITQPFIEVMLPYVEVNPLILIGMIYSICLVVSAMIFSIIFAVSWLRIKRAKWLLSVFKYIRGGASTRSIENWVNFDIWTSTLEQESPEFNVRIRDFDKNQVYEGEVEAFSEGGQNREILLKNATITDLGDSAKENLEPPYFRYYLYISLSQERFSLEYIDSENEEQTQSQEVQSNSYCEDERA